MANVDLDKLQTDMSEQSPANIPAEVKKFAPPSYRVQPTLSQFQADVRKEIEDVERAINNLRRLLG